MSCGTGGLLKTVMLMESWAVQPLAEVTIAVYVMLFWGVAITFGPLVVFKKLPGDQLMVPVAVAVISTLSPIQMVVSLGRVMVGELTLSVTCTVSEPQESAITTEKVVVLKIVAVGFEILGLSSTFAGDHA